MGKAARLKLERRKVAPVGKQQPRVQPKLVWLATAGLATVIAAVVIVLVVTRTQPSVAAAAAPTAADRNAPASLVEAADNVGFHPTTEPGVGLIEGEPASAAGAPSNPDLLAVRSVAPGLHVAHAAGLTGEPRLVSRQSGAARVLRLLVSALQRRSTAPGEARPFAPEPRHSRPLRECGRRDRPERVRVPPLLRPSVPGTRRPERARRAASTAPAPRGRSRTPTGCSRSRPST